MWDIFLRGERKEKRNISQYCQDSCGVLYKTKLQAQPEERDVFDSLPLSTLEVALGKKTMYLY